MRAMYFAVVIALAGACHTSSDEHRNEHGEAVDHYTVRGKLTALPSGQHGKEIEVDTERIPAFKGIDGKVSPMDPMPMPYQIGDVPMTGLSQGDPVEITFEVHWNDMPPLRLTRIVKLPAGTRLELDR